MAADQFMTEVAMPVGSAITTGHAGFTGLTWDHPRGYETLVMAARQSDATFPAGLIAWQIQSLEDFEERPIAELAARYDLIVLDHPHIGEAVAVDCLQPLETYFTASELAAWEVKTVGHALASYRWQGKHWALPIDVAAQVAAYQPQLLGSAPADWDEVVRISERLPVALSIAGPHAFLTFLSICAALGEEPRSDDTLFSGAVASAALSMMARINARAPAQTRSLNPIALLESMAGGEQIALIPLVFGYVNYAASRAGHGRIAFGDAPRGAGGARHGSVIGGTGIAFTARARPDPALMAHLRWLLNDETQTHFFTAHEGQPSARAAWASSDVNDSWNDFYSATRATIDDAIVRPRYDGYIAFQRQASSIIRAGLARASPPAHMLAQMQEIWKTSRANARGPLF